MNPYTGDLVRNMAAVESLADALAEAKSFHRLPERLQAAAEAALGSKDAVRVDLRKRGPLQAWARKKRKEKIAAKSRRGNRK
jgi:hypothetical protein